MYPFLRKVVFAVLSLASIAATESSIILIVSTQPQPTHIRRIARIKGIALLIRLLLKVKW